MTILTLVLLLIFWFFVAAPALSYYVLKVGKFWEWIKIDSKLIRIWLSYAIGVGLTGWIILIIGLICIVSGF